MPFSETYSALQIGAIDAQENPITTVFFMKFYEVQEHLALTNHGTLDQVVMVSGRWWEARSAPRQTAIRQAVTLGGDITAELTFTVIDSQALPAFAANGMVVHTLNDEDREMMRARVLPGIERVYLEQTGVRGRAILDAFNNEIAKYAE